MNHSIGAFIERTFTSAIRNKTYVLVDGSVLYTVGRSCIGDGFYSEVPYSYVYSINEGVYQCEIAKTSTNIIIRLYKP